MSNIELDPIGSGFNRHKINDNFQKIEDHINEELLSRNPSLGQANAMEADLDMNGNAIINADTDLDNENSLITVGDADERYVNVAGDTMLSPLSGPASVSPNNYIPQHQVAEVVDARLGSLPSYDPQQFTDYGFVSSAVGDTSDYGSIS